MKYKDKLFVSIKILSFPIILLFILGPLEILAGNVREFRLGLSDIIWMFLVVSFVFWTISSFVISFLPIKFLNILYSLIFVFSVCSYIQNLFLNKTLITKDGSGMDWASKKNLIITNNIIWIVMVILISSLIILLKERKIAFITKASIILAFLQLIAILSIVFTIPYKAHIGYQLDGEDQMKVAKNNNIIVLVLDRYNNEQFEALLDVNPEIRTELKDFTYYNNANSRYSNTYPSMPHLVTGQLYDYDSTDEEWLNRIWKEESVNSFYSTLHSKEYTVNLYSPDGPYVYGNIENMRGMIDNISDIQPQKDYKLMFRLFLKTSAYKYAPYIIKPHCEVISYSYDEMVVYVDHLSHWNNEFYDDLINTGLSIDNNMDNALIIQHILGLHDPHNIDENVNLIEDVGNSEEGILGVQKGLNVIVNEYISQLKELGVYDSSTIIITSDHGSQLNSICFQPLFLIKLPNDSHDDMQVCSAPISHNDFLPTVLDIIGEDYSNYGTSIFDWHEGDKRERMIDNIKESIYYTDRYEMYSNIGYEQ